MCRHGNCPGAASKGLFFHLPASGSSTTSTLIQEAKQRGIYCTCASCSNKNIWGVLSVAGGGKKGRLSDTPATCFLCFPNKEAAITMPWCAVLTQRRSREEPQNGRCLVPLTGINYCAWNRKKALTLWQHWHGLLLTSESSQADAGVSKTDERTLIFTEIWDVIQLCEALHKPVDIWTVLNRVNWITFHVKQFCFNYPSRYSRCSRKNEHFDSMWMNLLSKRGVKNQLQPGDQ